VLAYTFSSGGGANFITGDVNRDGRTDLVYGGYPRTVFDLLATSSGKFTQGPTTHYYIESVFQWALADLNGDGKLDLALSGTNSGPVPYAALYPGYGNGSFNTSYKALHPSGPWVTDTMTIAPLIKGALPSVMFQTGPNTLELFVNKTVK
jgi:hypothetical protein